MPTTARSARRSAIPRRLPNGTAGAVPLPPVRGRQPSSRSSTDSARRFVLPRRLRPAG
jgi:hypothetical protein